MADLGLDRRLTTRVLELWKKYSGDGFPRRSHIDPREFGVDWANCLMIDLDPDIAESRFSHVGNALRDPTWPTFDRQTISECLEGTLLEMLARRIPQAAAKRKPISFGGSAYHDNSNILYRTILLPLSESGERVDGILAAITFREIAVADDLPHSDIAESRRVASAATTRLPRPNNASRD